MTIKEPDIVPLEIKQFGELTTLPDIEQLESLEGKPEPETETVDPAGPEVGLSAIDGGEPVTVKAAEAESPTGLPVTVIMDAPEPASLATTNDADKAPPEIEQLEVPTGLPDNEQLVSAVEKSNPDTSIDAPTGAVGLSVIDGGAPLTVKLADAESPA